MTIIYFIEPKIHVEIDEHGRPITLIKEAKSKIISGSLMADRIRETMNTPTYDGCTLTVDFWGLVTIVAWINHEYCPRNFEGLETMLRTIVRDSGTLPAMLRTIYRIAYGREHEAVGEETYYLARVRAQALKLPLLQLGEWSRLCLELQGMRLSETQH